MSSWGRFKRVLSAVWRVLPAVTAVLSLFAIIISIYSFRLSQTYRRHDLSFEVVPRLYDKFYEMYKIQLDRPYLGHMLATPDRYPEVAHASSIMVNGDSDKEAAKYWLEERALAYYIFTDYEQLLYQWNSTKDEEREFVIEVLDFLEDSLLRNPRLLWWWTIKGGGIETSYEDMTRCEFQRNTLSKLDLTREGTLDSSGPLGYRQTITIAAGSGNLRASEVDCNKVQHVRDRK